MRFDFFIFCELKQLHKYRVVCMMVGSSCSSMVEQRPPKPKVGGSSPLMDAFLFLHNFTSFLMYFISILLFMLNSSNLISFS